MDADPSDAAAARRLRATVLRTPIPAAVADALRVTLESEPSLAIRSAASVEGVRGASFAGQFRSFLDVRAPEDAVAAVRSCWASRWSSSALAYRRAIGGPAPPRMAVLVQRSLAARSSGTAWTAGSAVEMESAWGLGPAVLSGHVVPDRVRVDERGVHVTPGWKPVEASAAEGNLSWRALDDERARRPSLDGAEALALAALARDAARVAGGAVEIEWVLTGEAPAVVQVRPSEAPPSVERGNAGSALRGIPAAPGEAAGNARIVRDSDGLATVRPEDVVVAPFLGAAAALLFRGVAIVTEMGGSSSHVAAIARERGIPMVCGVLGATRLIADGAPIRVDGGRGVVARG